LIAKNNQEVFMTEQKAAEERPFRFLPGKIQKAYRFGWATARRFLLTWVPTLILVLGGGNLGFNLKVEGASPEKPSTQINYPVKAFQDGKARFYEYKAGNGITIKYFILKSSDGIIRAAFDACDVCWPQGKGYFQKGDYMVCRNCGRRFASVRVNEVQGGCNPAPLQRQIRGDKLVIKTKDLLEGIQYFDFSRRLSR